VAPSDPDDVVVVAVDGVVVLGLAVVLGARPVLD
jgi:hypothetical protein